MLKKIIAPIVLVLVSAGLVFANTGPTQSPPLGNIEPPINTSTSAQTKKGDFTVGKDLTVDNSLSVDNILLVGNSLLVNGYSFLSGNVGINTFPIVPKK